MATFVREKSLHQIMQLINPDYPWKKIKSQKCVLWPFTKVRDPSNSFKMHQKLSFWSLLPFVIMYSSKNLIWCLTCLIFLKSSWWPVWTFSAQTHLNFQLNLLKIKIRKEHKKIFCGPSKIFENISWPINTCLKYFMTHGKTLQPLSYILNVWSLISIQNCHVRSQC